MSPDTKNHLNAILAALQTNDITREDILCALRLLQPGQQDPVTDKIMTPSFELKTKDELLRSLGVPVQPQPEKWLNIGSEA